MHKPDDAGVPAVSGLQGSDSTLEAPARRVGLAWRWWSSKHRPVSITLLLSLLIHTLLFSLVLGGDGPGLPGLSLPWLERRAEAQELRVLVSPAPKTHAQPAVAPSTAPPQKPTPSQPRPQLVQAPEGTPPAEPALAQQPAAASDPKQASEPAPEPALKAFAPPEVTTNANLDAIAADALTPLRTDMAVAALPLSMPAPAVVAMDQNDEPALLVPLVSPLPAPATRVVSAPARSASSAQIAPLPQQPVRAAKLEFDEIVPMRIDTEALKQAAELAKLETARLEAARQEQAQQVALRLEAARQESARIEASRLEAEKREIAKQAADQQEALQKEALRQEALRQAAASQEAAQEAARMEATRLAAEALQAARALAARTLQEETDRREAARRAMGRQLDEEAARREAAAAARAAPDGRPSSFSSTRRGRLFGRADANAELVLYAEAWARKIQLNMAIDMIRDLAKRPHTHPMVTVAIRRDGSVEQVTFVVSSGVAEIDETIRQIVQSLAPYPSFQPPLANEFDVIEIRRTWHVDTAIRLY